MRRTPEKAGFHPERIGRKAVDVHGKLEDTAFYAVLL